MKFKSDTSGIKQLRSLLLEEAIGCCKKCPLCYGKCTELTVGHQTHRSDVHCMTAFSGCHSSSIKNFVYNICTSRKVHLGRWAFTFSDIFLPFHEFMEKHYPDWSILVIEDAQIEIKNKIHWVKVRQRLCEYYELDDNIPQDWLILVEGYCPICMNTFGTPQCGNDIKTPCGHSICTPCLAQLRDRLEVK
ncbi:hypothetical protein BC937DRAFT_94414 [Endogone sp. FLAS-F59071]|nr:hypothetical protein BC937DRAFT_94414 [Endogone sp. FLAS-F59071]|eukprot:RUS14057.1 hypothetical protein BC937DRAFT_94414 [Endogone sp. FLAS-F59071]